MKIVLLLAFVVATLFGETEKTTTFKNMDIIVAYKEMKEGFADSYYLQQNIAMIKDIVKVFDDLESEIYGYKSLKVQWRNKNEVTIQLNAFENGERICTYRSYEIALRQVESNTQGVIESTMLYPQDIEAYIQNACGCNYFRGEEAYSEKRQKEIDEKMEQYCKPLPQVYKALQEKYKDKPKMKGILNKANDL